MKLDEVKDRLAKKYPEVGLTFGYIGNCGVDRYGPFDERLWMFFTHVPKPESRFCFSWGNWRTNELDGLDAEVVAARLEAWLVDKVVPRQDERYRSFDVWVSWSDAAYTEKLLTDMGADFGSRGGGHFFFGLRRVTLEQVRTKLPWAKVEESKW